MFWVNALMLVLVGLLLGWIPVLGPGLLGFLAGRAERGPRTVLVLLPTLILQTLALIGLRWLENTAERQHLDGWFWTALSWLGSPVSTALGRPLANAVGDSSPLGFVLLFTAPAIVGLILGSWTAGQRKRL